MILIDEIVDFDAVTNTLSSVTIIATHSATEICFFMIFALFLLLYGDCDSFNARIYVCGSTVIVKEFHDKCAAVGTALQGNAVCGQRHGCQRAAGRQQITLQDHGILNY
jgi:hypothetical protein